MALGSRVWIALALMAAAAAQRSTYDTSLDDADAYIGALGLPKGLPRLEVKYKKGGFGAKYYVSGSDSRISTRSDVALNERPLVEWEPTKFGAHQDRYAVMLLAPDEPKRAAGDGSADGEKGPILHWFALNCAQSTSKNDEKCYHLIPYNGPRSTDGILNDNPAMDHRYIFILFRQVKPPPGSVIQDYLLTTRENFNLRGFLRAVEGGLEAVAVNFFYAHSDKEQEKLAGPSPTGPTARIVTDPPPPPAPFDGKAAVSARSLGPKWQSKPSAHDEL